MPRTVKDKALHNAWLVANYGGRMYCDACGENIGYLYYATYDKIDLKCKCNCESEGAIMIDFEDSRPGQSCNDELIVIKNRLCCPQDKSPLITILDKKLD